jgi:hypothetical protein
MIEEWNNKREDVERMFKCNPLGCFIAEVNGKRVGHVFSFKYGKLGWIGLLIVRAECRRKGVGTLLMKKAMSYLLSCGAETIRLEAVSAIANLYRKLGFVDEYDSLRFLGHNQKIVSTTSSNVKFLKENMIKEIAEFDAKYFGANRSDVLVSLYRDYPKLCFISYAGSKIAGYLMCRKLENGYRVGPWVCNSENPQIARELLTRCMETIGQNEKIYVGVPAVNKAAAEILREFGFEQYSKSIRMRFGKELETECVSGVFAIGAPEKG